MRIVVFGLSVSSSWGNGHATLWRGLGKALGRRGHEIVFFERDLPYYRPHRDLTSLPWGELVLYSTWDECRSRAERLLPSADVAIVTSFCPEGVCATELIGERAGGLRVFYDLDSPVTLDRLESTGSVDYLGPAGLAPFDLVLSYTGGRALTALGERLGARRVAPLYGSVDPEAHFPAAPDPAFACDLSYLGTYAEDRQASLETLLVEPARRAPDRKFLIGGAMYPPEFPWSENIYFVRHIPPPEHAAFFGSSRLTLNVTRRAMAEMGYCPSGRLFEAAACGVPILSDPWDGLDGFFRPGEEILVAETAEDTLAALDLSDRELQKVGQAARARALEEHSAERRAIDFERAMEEAWGSPQSRDALGVG